MHDPLAVNCPDCLAPAGTPCTLRGQLANPEEDAGPEHHASRADTARAMAVRRGTCKLCGGLLYQLTEPTATFHAPTIEPECPPMPDPAVDWNAYAAWVNAGNERFRPGDENFIPEDEAAAS